MAKKICEEGVGGERPETAADPGGTQGCAPEFASFWLYSESLAKSPLFC